MSIRSCGAVQLLRSLLEINTDVLRESPMVSTEQGDRDGTTVRIIRSFLLGLFVLGTVGTGVELLLLEHTEGFWQVLPLGLMGLGGVALAWYGATGGSTSLRLFRATMGTVIVSGVVGLWLHYQGNAEFELEMYPSLEGLELFWEAVKGATPTLAPGTMLELGLIGLAYTYRHPGLARSYKGYQ